MKVMEVVNLSTSDWPGMTATVIFLEGCPLACPRCHNRKFNGSRDMSLKRLKAILEENSKILDAVVFSGGEALSYYKEITALGIDAKGMGLLVGLETSGIYPQGLDYMLRKEAVDRVFLDLKGPVFDGPVLQKRTGSSLDVSYRIAQSLTHLLGGVASLELRTTIFPDYPTEREVIGNFREIGGIFKGAKRSIDFRLLRGMPTETGDIFEPLPMQELQAMGERIAKKLSVTISVGTR